VTALAIVRKELRLYFGSPLFYVLASVILVLAGYLFYTNLHLYVLYGGQNLERGLWMQQFLDLRQLLIVLVPMLTMRLLAEERRLGTLELLWTYPIRDVEIVMAKFFACWVVLLLVLGATALHPVLLARIQAFPAGPLVAGYLGLALVSAAFVACGLFVSALTDSQLVAGAATYGVLLFFWLLNWNEAAVSDGWLRVLRPLSIFDRFELFTTGGIDTKNVVYFCLVTGVFLVMTLLALESRRWRGIR
jgi:ABC-2 type transport system permease protein